MSFTGLTALALDNGYRLIIYLAGTKNNLLDQTSKRLKKDLIGSRAKNNNYYKIHPNATSNEIEDIVGHLESSDKPIILIPILKHSKHIDKLIQVVSSPEYKSVMKEETVLIIDDEADQASISNTAVEYKQAQKERKGINKLIVHLVEDTHYKDAQTNGHVRAMNYVMYTATPYANFLNESTEESLYPRNFIWTLKTSNEYIGPNQIFGFNDPAKPDGLDIKRTITDEDLDRIAKLYDGEMADLPESLKDAICWFACAVATMRNWGYKKPISMLVHTSQKQANHDAIARAIARWTKAAIKSGDFLARCEVVYKYETTRITKAMWHEQFSEYGVPVDQVRDYLPFEEIIPEIQELIAENMKHIKMSESGDLEYCRSFHLVIDNCSKNGTTSENEYVRLAYPDPDMQPYPSPAPAFIIVGGSTLSRGLTIEGLGSTFFLRASCQADTLMQMGRWFGYRRNYELKHRTLREAGWKVLVVWKCELENNRKKETLRRIENQIRSNGVSQTEVIA